MAYEFRFRKRVEFAETDMAGIMHFAHFFRYMELAEHAFFRALGLSVVEDSAAGRIGWPRVQAACDFTGPLSFEDLVEVHLLVAAKTEKSFTYHFRFYRIRENAPAVLVASGAVTTVCAVLGSAGGAARAIAMPDHVAQQIEAAPPDVLARARAEK